MNDNISSLVFDLYHGAHTGSAHEFIDYAFSALKRCIPFDSAGKVTLRADEQGQIAITSLIAFRTIPNKAELRAELLGQDIYDLRSASGSDPLLHQSMQAPNQAHLLTVRRQHSSAAFFEYARRVEVLNALNFIDSRSGGAFASLSLWRAGADDVFTAGQQTLANQLVPHVLQAMAINLKLAARSLLGTQAQSGVIVTENARLIRHIDDLATTLLRREYPDWFSHHLPAELAQALQARSSSRLVGRETVMTVHRQGPLATIRVQPKTPGHRLTPAELRVVEQIVQRGTYKEAARHLNVSPSTIRNQLHVIYGKLGIASKSELVRMLNDG